MTEKDDFNYDLFIENSEIIQNKEQIDFIIKQIRVISEKSNKKIINLKHLYSATDDGDAAENFHSCCDGYAPILIYIKTKAGVIFGGYTEKPFASTKKKIGNKDDNAFIFSVKKRKIFEIEKGTIATVNFRDYGPVFSGFDYSNIYIYGDFFTDLGNVAKKGDRFNTKEDFEINDGVETFYVEEMEVYQVCFQEVNQIKNDK